MLYFLLIWVSSGWAFNYLWLNSRSNLIWSSDLLWPPYLTLGHLILISKADSLLDNDNDDDDDNGADDVNDNDDNDDDDNDNDDALATLS